MILAVRNTERAVGIVMFVFFSSSFEVYCTLHSVFAFKVCSVYCIVCSEWRAVANVQYVVWSLHCKLFIVY